MGRGPDERLQGGADAGGGRVEQDVGRRVGEPGLQVVEPRRGGAALAGGLELVADLGRREGLREVVARSSPDGLHGGVEGGEGGDDHHVQPRPLGEQARDEVEAALLAEPQVAEGQVVRGEPQRLERRRAGPHLVGPGAGPLDAEGQRVADVGLVVDDEHAKGDRGRVGHDVP